MVQLHFNPIAEVKKAPSNNGIYLSIQVIRELLPSIPKPSKISPRAQGQEDEPYSIPRALIEAHNANLLSELFDEEQDDLLGSDLEDTDEEESAVGSLSGSENESEDKIDA